MNQTEHNLLQDPIFLVRTHTQDAWECSLPDVMASLIQGELQDFLRLQAHQRQSLYCFLTQLGAMALARAGVEDIPNTSSDWRAHLLAMTDGAHEPWCLFVADKTAPAFLQIPLPSQDMKGYKLEAEFPDDLDILVTSKSHDVKMHRVLHPEPEHWVQSLINQQTLEGQMGAGNYGIARMNGGFGSRPFVSVAPSRSWASRFVSDLSRLLQNYSAAFEHEGIFRRGGYALLWLLPWDGTKESALGIQELDPYFLEVCRRLRMVSVDRGLVCHKASSKGRRVELVDGANGITWDPWAPTDQSDARKGPKVLTLSGQGLHYTLVERLIRRQDFVLPALGDVQSLNEQTGLLLFTGMVRGQGKTEGFHQRVVAVPKSMRRTLARGKSKEFVILSKRSQDMVLFASKMRRNVLFPALAALISGGEQSGALDNNQQAHVLGWTRQFDNGVDEGFFDCLFQDLSMTPQDVLQHWYELLILMARQILEEAIEAAPLPEARRYRVISQVEGLFGSLKYRHFSEQQPSREEQV